MRGSRRYNESVICQQLKRGFIPKALDYGHIPCASAFDACFAQRTSQESKSRVELLLEELMYGSYQSEPVYYVDDDDEELVPTTEMVPPTSFYDMFGKYLICS